MSEKAVQEAVQEAPAGQASKTQESAAQEQKSTAPAEPTRPEWLPEKFWDSKAKAPNVENLAKSYVELEKGRSNIEELKAKWEAERLAARPETPDSYTLPENEALDPEALAASPIVQLWRKAAYEAGLGQEQFEAVINEYVETEIRRMEAQREAEMAKLGDNAVARTQAVALWAQKVLGADTEEFAALQRMAVDAAGVRALEKLMELTRDIDTGAGDPPEKEPELTEADVRKIMNTPAYYHPQKRDPAVVARVEEFFRKKYGGKR
jgi:hypothetical protein